jgi:hypothetical protein
MFCLLVLGFSAYPRNVSRAVFLLCIISLFLYIVNNQKTLYILYTFEIYEEAQRIQSSGPRKEMAEEMAGIKNLQN